MTGKTKLDIILTPIGMYRYGICSGTGCRAADFKIYGMARVTDQLGNRTAAVLMGIVVSVLMGIFLTLPISSAAIGVILNLSGLAAELRQLAAAVI